jgi:two-component system, chemotaxis family, sensor kinase CheA
MTPDLQAELMGEFLLEARERLERLEEVLLAAAAGGGPVLELLQEAKLQLHTLKGNAGLVGMTELQALAHDMEDRAEALDPGAPRVEELLESVDLFRGLLERMAGRRGGATRPAPGAAGALGALGADIAHDPALAGVRIPFPALDALVDLLGEMVIFRNRLADALAQCRGAAAPAAARADSWEPVDVAHEQLGRTLDRLQDRVMRLRMVPLATLFHRLARIVHDESLRQGKEVRFETAGGDTPLDKALLELSSEALGHLVRNAVVHGLEPPQERLAAGKPRQGIVRLSAAATAREVEIDVADDGGGVRRDEVTAAAARHGRTLAPGEDPLSLLFLPGLTTRAGADLSAGRGIGLAAVQESVRRRGGRVEVFSEPGAGTLFRLRLPLAVSITRALLLASDGEQYALPLTAVVESVPLAAGRVHEINGAGVLDWRGGLVPLLDLGASFGTRSGAGARRRAGYAVVIEAEGKHRALAADQIQGIREVVVKGLDAVVGAPPGVSGSTVLGDGRAVLILDPAGLMAMSPFAAAGV